VIAFFSSEWKSARVNEFVFFCATADGSKLFDLLVMSLGYNTRWFLGREMP